MENCGNQYCTAFEGNRCIAAGPLLQVVRKVKEYIGTDHQMPLLIFNDLTSELIEIDFRGTVDDVLERAGNRASGAESASGLQENDQNAKRGPGRPRLGVVSREVTLLPRHWEWLNSQSGGASVALRKLVEEARRVNRGRDAVRQSQDITYRFISAIAGNLPGFEEAARALYAADRQRFNSFTEDWPADIRAHAQKLAHAALEENTDGSA